MSDDPGNARRHLGRLAAGLADGGRLVRGHELFESGAVHGIVAQPGNCSATVAGSRWQPYEVTVRFATLANRQLPDDPSSLRFTCTCPDWGDPCKHAIAVMLAIGQVMDDDAPLAAVVVAHDSVPPSVSDEAPTAAALAVPVERPSWAETVEPLPTPTTLPEWFGEPFEGRPNSVTPREDPLDHLIALGPLAAPDGPDLAGAIQVLLMTLLYEE